MIITSPETSTQTQGTLFLAGGITNCPDWQATAGELLDKYTTLSVFNPRRNGWDMNADLNESENQIIWEHQHLAQSEIIMFWFPKETLCPITLFELGKFLVSDKEIIIGTHPEYQRRFDVQVQAQLVRKNIFIHDDLEEMVWSIIHDHGRKTGARF